jgi:alpha-beta hydrolase superfamily lysophospholipase
MKRDDFALAGMETAGTLEHSIERHPMYFGADPQSLFGWYHHSPRAIARDCVAVLCAPVGPEYTRSHRTLRHLADRLARSGVPALRFDYHGIGDSAGADDDADRLGHWKRSIGEAAAHARRLSGCERVCLVGVRLGATLAGLEAADAGADLVVLWNPVVKGRAYARELQAIAMTARDAAAPAGDGLESAGFRISAETLEALKAADLTTASFKPGARVLLLDRDDLSGDGSLPERLAQDGVEHDRMAAPGWNGMMADHQFTVVPEEALETIRAWVVAHSVARPAMSRTPAEPCRETLDLGDTAERLCHFGSDGHLFGVLTEPRGGLRKATILMLNAGSIHHVGPHRLYVRLARELAAQGHPALRLDHEGLGDSVLRAAGRENHPYPPSAMEDLKAAIEFMRTQHGAERFILLGLCSGAHTAFHAGRELPPDVAIERLVLINPWYFYWSEGMSLDTSVNHYENVAAYRRSMRDPERWKKLLLGEVDVPRLARTAAAHVARMARGRWDDLRELLDPSRGTRLSRDLREIQARGRPMDVFVAEGEPAGAMLQTEAKRAVRRARRAGVLSIENILGADHTFSRYAARSDLVARIHRNLKEKP